jgi:peroxiredoxin Q/BCP
MLKEGSKTPDFVLFDQNSNEVKSSDLLGQKVIVYFYPKDHTPGCTRQACAFRDHYEEFKKKNVKVIGISKDSVNSHMNFKKDYELPFTLLADPDMVVVNAFGVAKANNGVNRSTFIINENGLIEKVFAQADPDNNATEILEYLNK